MQDGIISRYCRALCFHLINICRLCRHPVESMAVELQDRAQWVLWIVPWHGGRSSSSMVQVALMNYSLSRSCCSPLFPSKVTLLEMKTSPLKVLSLPTSLSFCCSLAHVHDTCLFLTMLYLKIPELNFFLLSPAYVISFCNAQICFLTRMNSGRLE